VSAVKGEMQHDEWTKGIGDRRQEMYVPAYEEHISVPVSLDRVYSISSPVGIWYVIVVDTLTLATPPFYPGAYTWLGSWP